MFPPEEFDVMSACAEYEERLFDLAEGTLSDAEAAPVREHLSACPACREFLAEQQRLDVMLAAATRTPRLSDDFRQRILLLTTQAKPKMSATEIAARKLCLQKEYDAQSHLLFRRVTGEAWYQNTDILNFIAMITATLLLVCVVAVHSPLMPALQTAWPSLKPADLNAGVTVVAVFAGAIALLRQRSWLNELIHT